MQLSFYGNDAPTLAGNDHIPVVLGLKTSCLKCLPTIISKVKVSSTIFSMSFCRIMCRRCYRFSHSKLSGSIFDSKLITIVISLLSASRITEIVKD